MLLFLNFYFLFLRSALVSTVAGTVGENVLSTITKAATLTTNIVHNTNTATEIFVNIIFKVLLVSNILIKETILKRGEHTVNSSKQHYILKIQLQPLYKPHQILPLSFLYKRNVQFY